MATEHENLKQSAEDYYDTFIGLANTLVMNASTPQETKATMFGLLALMAKVSLLQLEITTVQAEMNSCIKSLDADMQAKLLRIENQLRGM